MDKIVRKLDRQAIRALVEKDQRELVQVIESGGNVDQRAIEQQERNMANLSPEEVTTYCIMRREELNAYTQNQNADVTFERTQHAQGPAANNVLRVAAKPTGIVKWYDDSKGFGFITDENGEDLFVHFSFIQDPSVIKSLKEGELVTYERTQLAEKPVASNVCRVAAAAPTKHHTPTPPPTQIANYQTEISSMDSHEEEKEPLIEKSHAAGEANLTAGLNASNCRGKSVVARTRDEQAAMDKYGITFDGETYNFGGHKFVALSHAIKCAEPSPMDKYGITFDGETYNFGGRKFVSLSYAIKCAEQPAATVPLTLERHSMSIALVALAAIVVSAIVIYRTPSVSSSGSSSPTQNMSYMLVEQDKIKSRLKDPDSAEFRNVFVSSKYAVCGEVNAKNSFGGYTGFVRFISGGDMQVVESDMAAGEMDKSWPQICMR